MTNTTASQHTPQHIPFSSLYACCYWYISDMVLLQTVLRVAVRRGVEPSHKPTRHCGGGLKIPALSSFEHRTRQLLLIMVALRATSSSLALRHRPSSCYRLRLRWQTRLEVGTEEDDSAWLQQQSSLFVHRTLNEVKTKSTPRITCTRTADATYEVVRPAPLYVPSCVPGLKYKSGPILLFRVVRALWSIPVVVYGAPSPDRPGLMIVGMLFRFMVTVTVDLPSLSRTVPLRT